MGEKRKPAGVTAVDQEPPQKRSKPEAKAKEKEKKVRYVFLPRPDWHAAELPALEAKEIKEAPRQSLLTSLFERATKALETENERYNKSNLAGSSSHKFLSTIMSSGTLEDKISALTLLVQESPLHTMKAFDNLLGLSKKKSRNQALLAVAALKDLLGQGTVLPAERKLRAFGKQPGLISALQGISERWKASDTLPGGLQEVHLLVWAYEDWLKKKYFELLQTLESWCSDEIVFSRTRALTYIWELLKDKPEQEENLLRLLVNKLGDTDSKIASRASYLLQQLEITHPAMKSIITNSIEADCLFRPGQSSSAKYYAIITLNQTVLSNKEDALANKLLEIYFALFVQLLKNEKEEKKPQAQLDKTQGGGGRPGKMAAKKKLKQEELKSEAVLQAHEKLLAQVLTGVNRAFPFADTSHPQFEGQIDMLFKVTHASNFNTAVQALTLLQQISSTKHYGAERYYRTLYESLLDPRLATSSKQSMYLNLLYKSLKADVDIKRVQAFVKRLLQIITMHDPPFICSVLYLITELAKSFPSIQKMVTEPEVNEEDEEERFYDAPEDGEPAVASPVQTKASTISYDPRKRDPTHAHAEMAALWELIPTLSHFHPSVSMFAQAIAGHAAMPPKPDPATHTLMHFLDRFVYRNPKTKAAVTHGSSIMQPSAGSAAADLLVKPSNYSVDVINNEAFWTKKVEDVAPDQIFFHSYFNQAGNKTRRLAEKKKAKKSQDSEDEEMEDEDEDEVWQAIAGSRPDVEGPGDEDDLDVDDLEDYSDSDAESEGGIDLGGDEDDAEGIDLGGDDEEEEDEEEGGVELNDFEAFSEGDDDLPDLDSDDDDAVYGDDDEVAVDLDDSETEEPSSNNARNREKRKERKKFKQLPTFASAEDYAKLLADEPDDF